MKKQLRILNSKEIKKIVKKIEDYYGCKTKLDYAFLIDQKNKIYIISKDVDLIEFDRLRINSMGLYFAEINKYGEIRLTIEGSQLIGPNATKHVLELNKDQVKEYFLGHEVLLDLEIDTQPIFLLKFESDFFGAAKYKEGRLLNYLPKIHRTQELIV